MVFASPRGRRPQVDFASLEAVADVVRYEVTSPEDVAARCAGAQIVVNKELPLDAATIAGLPDSVALLCEAGTGYNNIHLATCLSKDIQVANVPTYATQARGPSGVSRFRCFERRRRPRAAAAAETRRPQAMAHMAITLVMALACSLWRQGVAFGKGDRSVLEQSHLGALPHVWVRRGTHRSNRRSRRRRGRESLRDGDAATARVGGTVAATPRPAGDSEGRSRRGAGESEGRSRRRRGRKSPSDGRGDGAGESEGRRRRRGRELGCSEGAGDNAQVELTGKTLGLVGGRGLIGREVAKIGVALGMRVVVASSSAAPGEDDDGVVVMALDDLFGRLCGTSHQSTPRR